MCGKIISDVLEGFVRTGNQLIVFSLGFLYVFLSLVYLKGQVDIMISCGLLGEKLGHSFSPEIHEMLGNYPYRLYEVEKEQLGDFLQSKEWTGLNVTIPYKKAVIPYLDSLSELSKRIGSVNTIVRKQNGELYGDNTDASGFLKMVQHSHIPVEGRKTLVLGSGGASASVAAVLSELNAEVVIISRSGENNYQNLDRHSDAEIIVNTTPVGMFPNIGVSPVDLHLFPKCSGVFDVIYNPAVTELLKQADELGIQHENGLYMLVAQAKCSAELFTGEYISDDIIDKIYISLNNE